MAKDKEFRVIVPDEYYQILKFKQEELPGIAVVNKNLAEFEPKEVFSWHCSVMLNCKELIKNGMPSKAELKILDEFGNFLDEQIKGPDKEKPNGLFLARITWNETRELIWRIYDPDITSEFLNDIIKRNKYPREFDYRIDDDVEWKLAEWYLKKRE